MSWTIFLILPQDVVLFSAVYKRSKLRRLHTGSKHGLKICIQIAHYEVNSESNSMSSRLDGGENIKNIT